jgi:CheY-like chemotaxis protein/HPt (histidine-containing phosphotransfer) domain-containing protein
VTGADGVDALRTEFSGEVRRRIDELGAAMAAADIDDVLRCAHKLKGSGHALALPELVAAMEEVEEAYRAQPARAEAARAALVAARLAADTGSSGASQEGAVALLSHALRTPLNVVLGFAHLLRDGDLRTEERAHADAIVQAAEQIAALIDEAAGAPDAARAGDPVAVPASAGKPVTVLYVEDDAASAHLAEEVLRRLPVVRLLVVGTGSEGIAVAERERPDLVLLDPGLPDITGDEVLRRLRAGPAAATPVVVVTGDTRPERLLELRDAGASDCLTKPVDPSRLLALVDAVRPG